MTADLRIPPGRRDRGANQERDERDPAPAPNPNLPPIVTRRLTKVYGDLVAVDSLDFEVHAGEIFGLLGQNGAGKTTTILMLLGLTEPTRGGSRVAGYDPTRQPLEVKRRVGYLPDEVGFYGGMTGRENLRYTARLNGIERREAEARIEEVLEQVGMTDRADTRVDTYSRGMQQRLGIADALLKDPAVLILDEPTTAIDPIGVVEILALLRRLVQERGLAVLLSSHLLTQVQSVCDRVGIFAAGRLIGLGTVPELATQFGDAGARIEVGFEALDTAAPAKAPGVLAAVPGVATVEAPERATEPYAVTVAADAEPAAVRAGILAATLQAGLHLSSIREAMPSLDDIYRRALHEHGLAGTRSARERRARAAAAGTPDGEAGAAAEGREGAESGASDAPRRPRTRVVPRKGGRKDR